MSVLGLELGYTVHPSRLVLPSSTGPLLDNIDQIVNIFQYSPTSTGPILENIGPSVL